MRKILATILAALLLAVPVGAMADTTVIGVPPSPVAGDLIPDTDNAYDLGSSSAAWATGYFNVLSLADGTAAAPSLTFSGDTNSGLYRIAADTLGWATGGSERMRLDASGNLGVGTTTPGYRLHVSTDSAVLAEFKSTSTDATILFIKNSDAGQRWGIGVAGSASLGGVPSTGAFYIRDETGADPKLILDTSGNLGLGVTPEAWSGAFTAMQLGGRGAWFDAADAGSSEMSLAENVYHDGTAYKRIQSGYASAIRFGSGTVELRVAGTDLADTAITWTTALTIDNSGNIILGNGSIGSGAVKTLVVADGTKPTTYPSVFFYATGGEMHVVDTAGNDTTISPHDAMSYFADWYKVHPNVPPLARITSNAYTGKTWAVNDGAVLYYAAHPNESRKESDIYKLVEDTTPRDWDADQAAIKAEKDAKAEAARQAKIKQLVKENNLPLEVAEAQTPPAKKYQKKPMPRWIDHLASSQ